eukprot:CAMPEP_0180312270 /NCGR_PEP_ID=MMETSP0988-20121125/30723_1 /TAXON_ID=697907 /ORGANISM="non described non described, Strain CCMP2293" /LENGTH=182 /DNA_ID=CAMNT_0022296465 /DNA_START=174 /DNA_END=722 /DNA_ORIENTATION=-
MHHLFSLQRASSPLSLLIGHGSARCPCPPVAGDFDGALRLLVSPEELPDPGADLGRDLVYPHIQRLNLVILFKGVAQHHTSLLSQGVARNVHVCQHPVDAEHRSHHPHGLPLARPVAEAVARNVDPREGPVRFQPLEYVAAPLFAKAVQPDVEVHQRQVALEGAAEELPALRMDVVVAERER